MASAKTGITKKVNRLDTNQWSWSEALVDSATLNSSLNVFVFFDHLKAGSLKNPRFGHSVVRFNSKLMVIAGSSDNSDIHSQEASEICDMAGYEVYNCISTHSMNNPMQSYLYYQQNQVAIPVLSSDYDSCS